MPTISYLPASEADFESLLALRIAAMRPSLEALGRFDPERARTRFRDSFVPEYTRHILCDGVRVGFYALKPQSPGLLLDHLYLAPSAQGQGLGSQVLAEIFHRADQQASPLHVGALRGSDANRFYQSHGFVPYSETEWDIYYHRLPTQVA